MSSSTKPKESESLDTRLGRVADAARAGARARICVLALVSGARSVALATSAGAEPEWQTAADAMLEVLSIRRELDDHGGRVSSLRFAGTELAALHGVSVRLSEAVHAVACACGEDDREAKVAIIAPAERSGDDLEAVATLGCEAALAILTASEKESTRQFWQARATEASENASRASSQLNERSRDLDDVERLLGRVANLSPRERYAAFAALIADDGPFDGWIVGLVDGHHSLEPVASSSHEQIGALNDPSALRRSHLEQSAVTGRGSIHSAGTCHEDRIFGRPYVCVPFEVGAIALASRTPINESLRARVQAKVRQLAPLIKSWWLEDELGRTRELVRKLGVRMFAAIDEERSRIARDLHDDQAQLLAAAQIALQGGRDQARGIFKRLEKELRQRVRELKPAKLGEMGLDEALRLELGRLTDAGIKVRLKRSRRNPALALSRPVEELCYQVAREAVSNVIRHSGATRVEVSVERRRAAARISVADDGHGMEPGHERGGMGLRGLRERLELMGGTLTIESKPGATRLVADIPEPS